MIDKIFKMGLLVLGFLYLACLYCPYTNQIRRYCGHSVSYANKTKRSDYQEYLDYIRTEQIKERLGFETEEQTKKRSNRERLYRRLENT